MIHTEDELFELNKKGQVKLLNELGAGDIPKLEADRVKLIMELEQKFVNGTNFNWNPSTNVTLGCPNCGSVNLFIKINEQRNEYICNCCGKGYSGYPPPSI